MSSDDDSEYDNASDECLIVEEKKSKQPASKSRSGVNKNVVSIVLSSDNECEKANFPVKSHQKRKGVGTRALKLDRTSFSNTRLKSATEVNSDSGQSSASNARTNPSTSSNVTSGSQTVTADANAGETEPPAREPKDHPSKIKSSDKLRNRRSALPSMDSPQLVAPVLPRPSALVSPPGEQATVSRPRLADEAQSTSSEETPPHKNSKLFEISYPLKDDDSNLCQRFQFISRAYRPQLSSDSDEAPTSQKLGVLEWAMASGSWIYPSLRSDLGSPVSSRRYQSKNKRRHRPVFSSSDEDEPVRQRHIEETSDNNIRISVSSSQSSSANRTVLRCDREERKKKHKSKKRKENSASKEKRKLSHADGEDEMSSDGGTSLPDITSDSRQKFKKRSKIYLSSDSCQDSEWCDEEEEEKRHKRRKVSSKEDRKIKKSPKKHKKFKNRV